MFFGSLPPWILALALLQPVSAEDTVSSGNYLIHRCNSGQPDSEAFKLQSLLPQVWNGLQKVIADLKLGTASSHGYSTFFKNDSSKEEVLQVYQKIADGASVTLGRIRSTVRRPTLICANDVPATDLLYQYCMRQPNSALASLKNTELITICPFFWLIKEQATLPDCPLVVANTLTPNDERLVHNQEALLVGILVHLYHKVDHIMLTNIAEVSELTASESLLHSPTYAFYYSAVQAGCTSFPNMQKPHDEFRRLLEVPINSSNDVTGPPVYSEIPSSVPMPPDLNTLQDFCNGAVFAPNTTVCCDESTGLWIPAPVIRDESAASPMSASCPQGTRQTGVLGAGIGVINTRKRRLINVR